MLRITPAEDKESSSLKLEGSIRGPWVSELAKAWQTISTARPGQKLSVELSGVSFADWEGRKLLLDMQHGGAQLNAASVFLRHMLAEHSRAAADGQKTGESQ